LEHNAAAHSENKETLARWIDLYSDTLLKTCYVYLHNITQAEDALQDTFIKAFRSMHQCKYHGEAYEKAWLVRIAINVCHDYYRSRWFRYVDKTKRVENLPAYQSAASDEDHELLWEVYALPEKLKQVLLLYYYQEMTLQETAGILGISRSAVHKRLQKAQKLLKSQLTGRDIDAQ